MKTSSYILDKPTLHYQESTDNLIQQTIQLGLGKLADTGALCVNTGKFTGRSPENKYFVKDDITANTIDWGGFNNPIDQAIFIQIR